MTLYLYFKSDRSQKYDFAGFDGKITKLSNFQPPKKPKRNKSEEKCREIFEKIYNAKFPSVRPNWLQNPVTGHNLELDGYCEYIPTPMGKGLAFEYDGEQHSKFNPHFHRSGSAEFEYQVKKDLWKDRVCEQNSVMLIRIPHYIAYEELEEYIVNKLKKKNVYPYAKMSWGSVRYRKKKSNNMYDN